MAAMVLNLICSVACAVALLAMLDSAQAGSKAQLFQDSDGNLHISSVANQSVFVNAMNVPERIRQLEAANAALATSNAALAASNEALAASNEALAASNAAMQRQMNITSAKVNQRLAALEAIAASHPDSLTNSTATPTTTSSPRTTALPPIHPVNNGSRVWTKILGSGMTDDANGVAVDSSDFIYIGGGSTASSVYPFDGAYGSGADAVAVRLTPEGTSLWTKFVGASSSAGDWGQAIATDSTNNVFVAGYVGGSLDSNPYFGKSDSVVFKLNNNGVKKWSRQVGSTENEFWNAVAVDKDDNVVTAGYTEGSVAGSARAGRQDIVLAKYSGSGDLLWLRQFGTALTDAAYGVATDSTNNIYVTGLTSGRLVEDAEAGADTATGSSTDMYLGKFDKNGTRLWIRQLGSDEADGCKSIALDSVDNIYLACYSEGDLDGFLNVGLKDVYVFKFDTNGAKLWSRRLATTAEEFVDPGAIDIAVDTNNFVYVTGWTYGGLEGNSNMGAGGITATGDVFVAQYDSDGTRRWLRQFGSSGQDNAGGIAVDSNNAVYVTGSVNTDGVIFDGVPTIRNGDIFLTKFV